MREVERIERITKKLAELWSYVPDWRFNQLLCNFFTENDKIKFYEEDNKIEEKLDFLIKRMQEKDTL